MAGCLNATRPRFSSPSLEKVSKPEVSDSAIKSSRRAFEILEAFETTRRPMALKEFVERFGYPASSASALLKSLVSLGYLDYDRFSRTYMPTMRIASLGHWVHGALFGDGKVLTLMQRLSRLTGETVTLTAQSDLSVQYVHLIPSILPIWYQLPIGSSRPLALSGLGWLMLGTRSDKEIERLVRRMNFREPDRSKRIVLAELLSRVEQARAEGYVFSRNTLVEGAGSIGMLLPGRRFSRVFAIGVHGPIERLEEKQALVLRELRAGVRRLEKAGAGREAQAAESGA